MEAKAYAAERAKLIEPDKRMITTICTEVENLLRTYTPDKLNTPEANNLIRDMFDAIAKTIHDYERGGQDLV